MKNKFYFLFLLVLMAIYTPAKAILVNIPDANFRARLQTLYPTCFVGAQMETTCTGVVNETSLNVAGRNISDIGGVEYFTSLTVLLCSNNLLTNLPVLPASLVRLQCGFNQLTSLPTLSTNLTILDCNENLLTSLPILPASLQNLSCNRNFLDFDDLEGLNRRPSTYQASPQKYSILPATQSLIPGSTLTINGLVGGSLNVYKWYRNNTLIAGATSATYNKINITIADVGMYRCEVTSTYAGLSTTTGVSIISNNVNVSVCAGAMTVTPTLNPAVWSTPYSQILTQTGLTGAVSWSLLSGVLIPGLSISTTTGTISGLPQSVSPNIYIFTIRITNGTCTLLQTYSHSLIACQPVITINPATLPNGTLGVFYSQTLTQIGLNSSSWDVQPGFNSLPNGLSLAIGTGIISGTPSATGTFNFAIRVTDTMHGCTQTQAYTIVIGCSPITISPATLPNSTNGASYSQTLTQTGLTGAPVWSISVGILPNGLSITSNTGLISGTINAAGTFNFTARVTNGTCTQTQAYTIVVSCPTITISPTTLVNGFIGASYSQTLSQVGLVGTPIWSLSVGSLPSGLNFIATVGLIAGTPNALGTFNFTISVTDGVCTRTKAYSIVVGCPTITISPTTLVNGIIGTPYSQTISQIGLTGTLVWSISVGSLPNGLSIAPATGIISGSHNAVGTFNFTIRVTNGICAQIQASTIVVNCPPVTLSPTTLLDGVIGISYSQTISQTGLTGVTFFVTAGTLPSGLALVSATGIISGTPSATGTFNFTIQATNGLCTQTQIYSIIINCAGIIISPATLTNGIIGTSYTQTLTQTGLTGTPTWSVSVGSLPNNLSIAPATGIISGIPSAGGTFNFTVLVTNGTCTQTRASTIVVSCPIITFTNTMATNATIGNLYNLSAVATGNTNTLTYSVLPALPTGLSLNATTGIISGTPTTATISASYVVTAGQGTCSATQTYTFEVLAVVNNPTSPTNPTTSMDNSLSNLIKIFPNPSKGDFSIDFGTLNVGKAVVRIYDTQGKQVFSSEKNDNSNLMLILLNNVADGIYLLKIETSKGVILKRIQKAD